MNKTRAKNLLKRIQVEKSAMPDSSSATNFVDSLRLKVNQQMQSDTVKNIFKALAISAGAGAVIRGSMGFSDEASTTEKGPRVIDMPVAYVREEDEEEEEEEEKKAEGPLPGSNERATSPYGLDYFLPSMLLGAPLAAYGGWKGVDWLLNKVKEKESKARLEAAKKKYEAALLGAYKHATDSALTQAFVGYRQKAATVISGLLSGVTDLVSATGGSALNAINTTFPNASGISKGLALTWLLAGVPAGYFLVNKIMKKNSKRQLLDEAIAERARRQAVAQPPEIYAIPHRV